MAFVLKSSIHWLFSFQLMLLIVIGRKTGRQFEIPVSFAKLDGVYVALTLKANQWWRNLRGGTCTAVIRGERVACTCLLYTSPSPRDGLLSRMPSSA